MKYSITINQVGIIKAGLHTKTDSTDWALIEYINDFLCSLKKKSIIFENRELVWINYSHLSKAMPFFRQLKYKPKVSDRFKKLKRLGLIITKKVGYEVYARPTDLAISVKYFKENKYNSESPTVTDLVTVTPLTVTDLVTNNNTINYKNTKVSKDTLTESNDSEKIFKTPFIKKCILDWNELSFTQNIRITKKTKTIQKLEKYILQLLKGSFINNQDTKQFDAGWFKDNKIPITLKRLSKKQILIAIKNTALYCKEGYWPENKSYLPKDLSTLIYNPRTGKSWFLKALYSPPKPLSKEREIQNPDLQTTEYLISQLNGKFNKHKMPDKLKLFNGVKSIKQFVECIPQESLNRFKIRNEVGTPLKICKEYIYWMKHQDWIDEINLSVLNANNKLWKKFIKEKEEDYAGYTLC